MKAVWVDEGNDPNLPVIDKAGIDQLYFSLQDPRVTLEYLNRYVGKGYGVGVYVVSNWGGYQGLSGADFAKKVAAQVRKIRVSNVQPRVQLDMEQHDPDYVIQVLDQWRREPGMKWQATSWTMEGLQGGWLAQPSLLQAVIDNRIRVVPQAYTGDMKRISEDLIYKDMRNAGYPDSIISLFYDAKDLGIGWDGWAFTMGRLPQ